MKKPMKVLMSDLNLKLNYQAAPITETFVELGDDLRKVYGVNLALVPTEDATAALKPDLSKLFNTLTQLTDEATHKQAISDLTRILKTKKSFRESTNYKRSVHSSSIREDTFTLPDVIDASIVEIGKISEENIELSNAAKAKLKNFRYTTDEAFELMLTRLIDLPVPYTKKRIKILPKTLSEITLSLKDFLKMVSLFGGIVILLEKRVTDWVLLKGLMFILWGYIFWVIANEVLHIEITDADKDDEEAIESFKASFLKLKFEGNEDEIK